MDSFHFFILLWLSHPNESLTEYKVPKWVGYLKVIYYPVAREWVSSKLPIKRKCTLVEGRKKELLLFLIPLLGAEVLTAWVILWLKWAVVESWPYCLSLPVNHALPRQLPQLWGSDHVGLSAQCCLLPAHLGAEQNLGQYLCSQNSIAELLWLWLSSKQRTFFGGEFSNLKNLRMTKMKADVWTYTPRRYLQVSL